MTQQLVSVDAHRHRSNQVAYWALSQGLQKGDVVALIMPSCPDYGKKRKETGNALHLPFDQLLVDETCVSLLGATAPARYSHNLDPDARGGHAGLGFPTHSKCSRGPGCLNQKGKAGKCALH